MNGDHPSSSTRSIPEQFGSEHSVRSLSSSMMSRYTHDGSCRSELGRDNSTRSEMVCDNSSRSLRSSSRGVSRHESSRTSVRSDVDIPVPLTDGGGGNVGSRIPSVSMLHPGSPSSSPPTSPSSSPDEKQPRRSKSLVWSNITMSVTGSSTVGEGGSSGRPGYTTRKILDNVSGSLPPGRVTALMGPSGAGKTSLLNVLAGRVRNVRRGHHHHSSTKTPRRGTSVTTSLDYVLLDRRSTHRLSVRRRIAFCAQDDSLTPTSTPREALRFSAKLRLPRGTPGVVLNERVEDLLRELGLEACADTMIGGEGHRHRVSGGERKRTSVGVELVVRPEVLFLDEPTSGLDSYAAQQLVQTLVRVSRRDHTSVLCTIHQPSSEVFTLLDNLIFLHQGRILYHGGIDQVEGYFAARGRTVPLRYNPADWIMHVAQSTPVKMLEKAGFYEPCVVDHEDQEQPNDDSPESSLQHDVESNLAATPRNLAEEKRVTLWTQFLALSHREITTLYRDPSILGARLALNILMATLIGVIFWKVGAMDDGDMTIFQSHFGGVFMVLLNSMFGAALPTLLSFPQERPVFLREYATEHYSALVYFVSRLVVESTMTLVQIVIQITLAYHTIQLQAPYPTLVGVAYALAMASTAVAVVLGCAVQDPKLGQEMLPVIFVPQLLFAGFFVSTKLIPEWLRWIQYLCPLMYATRLVLLAEFEHCAPGTASILCQKLLENNNARVDGRWWYWTALLGLFFLYRIVALIILTRKATRH